MKLLLVGAILVILSQFLRRNRVLYFFQLFYLWLVASFNNMNPDYSNYLNGYNLMHNYHGTITEPMYWVIVRFAGRVGLDYQGFRLLFFFIAYALLGIAIWKLSPLPNSMLGLYTLLPFTEDVIQMRTLMANALAVYSIYELEKYSKHRTRTTLLKSLVLLFVGIGFHYSTAFLCLVYLALVDKRQLKKYLYALVPIAIALLIAMVFLRNHISALVHSSGIVPKFSSYYIHFESIGGYRWGIFLLRLLLVPLCYLAIKAETNIRYEYDKKVINEVRFLFKAVVVLTVLAFVELFVSMELGRLLRIPLLLGMILISRTMLQMRTWNRRIISFITIAYYVVLFYWSMFMHYSDSLRWIDHVFMPIFNNNVLG